MGYLHTHTLNPGAMNLFHVSGNKKAYTFEWGTNGSSVPKIGNFLWNSKSDRAKAADAMVKAIMVRVKENGGSEDVTLIGHSHGGNSIDERNIFLICSGDEIPNKENRVFPDLYSFP